VLAHAGMATGGLTSQPIGHYEFCKANTGRMLDPPARDAGPETHDRRDLWSLINGRHQRPTVNRRRSSR
jgi:predicted transglutaminase-like cysteine proteinase